MVIENGKKVHIAYSILEDLDDNKVLQEEEKLSYIHGNGMIIPGLESALTGKETGNQFIIQISPQDGYGNYNPELMADFPVEQFSHLGELEPGQILEANQDDQTIRCLVRKIENGRVYLDANHPHAGKTLVFDVKVLDVTD